ncbi:hypothetical protein NSMM_50008 [Nitrosomonas mobilis]|uniref:Uncharacterized protein n=1 Tax=Nitrosomonas mobilis TaxID=51642 RepID=A0A1G5SG68_9PROT|nr:hypothetical protein NSMM_50008 [Nitrosomonas mobilis]
MMKTFFIVPVEPDIQIFPYQI